MNVLVIYGSLREKSINKALAQNVQAIAGKDMKIDLAGVDGFPLFSEDLEKSGAPEIATEYKQKIKAADAIIVVTPEYNRSMPGSLKNMLDWTSRGELPWKGKPVGVIGASDGVRGASFAQYDVKRVLTYFGAHVMGQPELYFGNADKKIDAEGTITDEKTVEYLKKYLSAFKTHVERFS